MSDIVLKDRNGNPVEYPGVDIIKVNTVGGVQGYAAFDPETLIPENIVEGVQIGNIIGALKVGGSAKIASGADTQNSQIRTIEHNLGVVPDIIVVLHGTSGTTSSSYLAFAVGHTAAFTEIAMGSAAAFEWYAKHGVITQLAMADIAAGNPTTGPIYAADETKFTIGTSDLKLTSGDQYRWFAIGGLT